MGRKRKRGRRERSESRLALRLADRLRELVEASGKSPREVADAIDVDESIIYRMMRCDLTITAERAQQIAHFLHVPVASLFEAPKPKRAA